MATQQKAIRLTKKAIAAVPSGIGWVRVEDQVVIDLYINSGSTKKSIYIRRRIKGQKNKRFFKVCTWEPGISPEQIRKKAHAVASDILDGIDPNKVKKATNPESVLLKDAFERYMSTRTKGQKPIKASTVDQYRISFETVLKPLKDKKLTEITGDDVEKLHLERSKTSPSMANNATRLLGRIFRLAKEVYRDEHGAPIITYNPADRVSTLKLHNKLGRRTGHIHRDQLKAWFDAVYSLEPRRGGDAARDLLIFTLLTGLRRNEAAKLTWDRVDLDKKSFSIIENKADRPVELPLSDYLYDMLTERRKKAGNRLYVFPAGNNSGYLADWRHWTNEVGKKAGLSFIPHDLRRTFATVAESLDISPYTIKALVNHSLPADDVTGGYIQIDVERMREPMQRITDFFLTEARQVRDV